MAPLKPKFIQQGLHVVDGLNQRDRRPRRRLASVWGTAWLRVGRDECKGEFCGERLIGLASFFKLGEQVPFECGERR